MTVPWFVADHDERKQVRSDPPVGDRETFDSDVVDERLAKLGYW